MPSRSRAISAVAASTRASMSPRFPRTSSSEWAGAARLSSSCAALPARGGGACRRRRGFPGRGCRAEPAGPRPRGLRGLRRGLGERRALLPRRPGHGHEHVGAAHGRVERQALEAPEPRGPRVAPPTRRRGGGESVDAGGADASATGPASCGSKHDTCAGNDRWSRSGETSNLSLSVASKSFRLSSGRLGVSRRGLDSQRCVTTASTRAR